MRTCFSEILVALAITAALAGCQSSARGGRTLDSAPQLDADSARAAGLSPQQVSDATELYSVKCAKCQKFYDPVQYSKTEWDDWMHKMSRKSKLKPAQEELLTRYLNEYREKHK